MELKTKTGSRQKGINWHVHGSCDFCGKSDGAALLDIGSRCHTYICPECAARVVGLVLTAFEGWREELAAVVHRMWIHWMKCMQPTFDGVLELLSEKYEGRWPESVQEIVERWKRQMAKPYSKLSEKEKDIDREQADKILAALGCQVELQGPVEIRYVSAGGDPKLVSSARLTTVSEAHDKVQIWNRGGLAGELCLKKGDGEELMRRLHMERDTGDE